VQEVGAPRAGRVHLGNEAVTVGDEERVTHAPFIRASWRARASARSR
jgi:hypothetical protein